MFVNPFYLAAITYMCGMFFNASITVLVKYACIHTALTMTQIIFFRSLIAFLILSPSQIKKITSVKREHLSIIIIVGIIAVVDVFLWHGSVSLIPINNAIIISFCTPVFITILARFILKEQLRVVHIMSFIISISSIILLYKISVTGFNYGYIIVSADVLIAAIGFVLTKKLTQHYDPFFIVYLKICAALPLTILVTNTLPNFDIYSIYVITIAALVYVAERYCITQAYRMYDMIPLQPVRFTGVIFAAILGYFVMNEKVELIQIMAFTMIILANYINVTKHNNYTNKLAFSIRR